MDSALVLTSSAPEVRAVDSLLDRRHPAPPPEDDAETTGLLADENAAASSSSLPARPGPVAPHLCMAPEERVRVHSDVYGRPPPDVERSEFRVAALQAEIRLIPDDRRGALRLALRSNPTLFVSSPHVRMLVREEPFDPRDAAGRLVRYWERRRDMFGDRAFSDGVFVDPTYDDYLRYYDRCVTIANDSGADNDARRVAAEYVRCVHKVKIEAMHRIVMSSPEEEREAYLRARENYPELAGSAGHQLLFLLCEDFVEARAARRIMRYWTARGEDFGTELGRRNLFLADADEDGFLVKGKRRSFARLMPGTDTHGRTIMTLTVCDLREEGWTEKSVSLLFWYVMQAAAERDECVRNGMVVLVDYRTGRGFFSSQNARLRSIGRNIMLHCAPVQIKAIHAFFQPDGWLQRLFGRFSKVAGILTRVAVVHLGTNEENVASLEKSYGISRGQVPVEMGGEVEYEDWLKEMERRRIEGW